MFRRLGRGGAFLLGLFALCSCKDDDGVGLSIQPSEDILKTYSGTARAATALIRTDSVLSKSEYLYLGQYTDKNFGISRAEFMTQLDGRVGGLTLPDTSVSYSSGVSGITASILTSVDERYGNISKISSPSDVKLDSVHFYIQYGDSFFGDSVALQSVSVYELNKSLPSDNKLYSNIDASEYYSSTDLLGQVSYAVKGGRIIRVPLPQAFGEDLLKVYTNQTITEPSDFLEKYKGFYVKHSFNEGAIINCTGVGIQLFYSYDADIATTFEGRDTVIRASQLVIKGAKLNPLVSSCVIAANKAVSQVNLFSHPDLEERLSNELNNKELVYCYSPAGLYTSVKIPFDDIMSNVKRSVKDTSLVMFNSVRLRFHTKRLDWATKYSQNPNRYLLLVERDKMVDFFYNNESPDMMSSFIAEYNSDLEGYAFDITRAVQQKMKEKAELKDLVLVPVYATSVYAGSGSQTNYYKQQLSPSATQIYSSEAEIEFAPFIDYVYSERE